MIEVKQSFKDVLDKMRTRKDRIKRIHNSYKNFEKSLTLRNKKPANDRFSTLQKIKTKIEELTELKKENDKQSNENLAKISALEKQM